MAPRSFIAPCFLALLVGCSANASKEDEPQTVQMKKHVEETVRPPAEPLPPAPPPERVEEELEVEIIDLNRGATVTTESGTTVKLVSSAPPYRITFSRNGQTETASHDRDPLYIEGVAFGELYVVSKFGSAVQVTLRSDAPRAPLPERTALDIARTQRGSQLGCDEGHEETFVEGNGTVALVVRGDEGSEVCRITVGRFTGKVVDL